MRFARCAPFLLLATFLAACGGDDGGNDFDAPRAISLAPDGRLIVADAGTGNDDGRVLALTLPSVVSDGPLDPAEVEVLMEDLPSSNTEDRGYTGMAGPAAAAMAEDGVVCAVISATDDQPGELRCSDGLTVDLTALEAERDPDGAGAASDPAGIAADGLRGWFVSDAAANDVLFIDREGNVTVVAVFKDIEGIGESGAPLGLFVVQGSGSGPAVGVALFAGALAGFSPALAQPPIIQGMEGRPIALADDGAETIALLRSALNDDHGSGSVYNMTTTETMIDGLDRPSGFVRLPDGRFIVSFERDGVIEVLSAN